MYLLVRIEKSDFRMNEIESKVEIVPLTDKLSMHFIYVPKGYEINNYSLEGHIMERVGKLNSFNRLKALSEFKKKYPNPKNTFGGILTRKGWDFIKHPNPTAFLVIPKNMME